MMMWRRVETRREYVPVDRGKVGFWVFCFLLLCIRVYTVVSFKTSTTRLDYLVDYLIDYIDYIYFYFFNTLVL